MKKLSVIFALCSALIVSGCDGNQAKVGDTLDIEFAGFLNGVQFPGGTGTAPLKLGSGQFIPGFEEQLIGAKSGEEREVKVKFPENYPVKELAGQATVFKVKVLAIK